MMKNSCKKGLANAANVKYWGMADMQSLHALHSLVKETCLSHMIGQNLGLESQEFPYRALFDLQSWTAT